MDIAMNVGKMKDESYRNKVRDHSKNTQDFIHYKIEYTRHEKVSCTDNGEHPKVYYTVPVGETAVCEYCNKKWIRK